MREFHVCQISDTHLARFSRILTENFRRVSEHIDATRPDIVINTGDLTFDAVTNRDDLAFAKALHNDLPAVCRVTMILAIIRPSLDHHRSSRSPKKTGSTLSP